MILFVRVRLKDLLRKRRKYPWPRPHLCPGCEGRGLWGHGFVLAYFDGFDGGVFLRRYRCPGCGVVLRLRPKTHFSRFQAPVSLIYASIRSRVRQGRYLPRMSVSRQRHWLRALFGKVTLYLGNPWQGRLLDGFRQLMAMGKVPVSRSI